MDERNSIDALIDAQSDPEWMKRFEDAKKIIRHDLESYLKDDSGE